DWSYIWENLPRFVDDDEAKGKYYYTIKEITAVKGYEEPEVSGGDINAGGTVVIINKAKTVDIPAEKIWSNDTEYTPVYPKTVKFKLQVFVNNKWIDVPGKTITITGTGNNKTWSGKFTGLIEGYQYQVVEVDVPYGWTPQYDDATVQVPENVPESFDGKFEVTNQYAIDEGSIALAKLWEGENAARPYEIYLDLYRSVVAPSYTKTDAPYTDGKLTGNNDPDYKDDYMRLLQHSLYFYDANMCGTDVSTSSDLAWRTNCHTEDEILGGYHDAGDHVMFGLPQGYTASMLSWMYLEFFKGNVTDSDGNVKNDDTYMMNHYEDDHFKVILERFYDFFENSVEYGDDGKIKKLLLQKGQGNIDHLIWCAPEIQKNRENEMIWSETQGSNIAAEYAAALALGYLNFYDSAKTDKEKEKYENYLKIAEDLYEFSGRTTSFIASDSEGTYYKETDEPNPASDDRAWAAAWLYQATKDRDGEENTGYKDARSNSPNQLQWDDVSFSAACAYASQTGNWTNVINKIDSEFINNSDAKKKDFYYIHEWGTARFNAMAQTAVLITAKHLYETPDAKHKYSNNTEISYNDIANSYVAWAEGQMDKILGNNTWKDTISTNGCVGGTVEDTNLPICLVTNFVPDGFNVDTPQNPHHRAASGLDSVNGDSNLEYKDSCVYDDDSYTLVGALVGGPAFGAHSDQAQMIGYDHKHPLTDHDYIDDLHDYCCNEVAIDYNAGLVGAAAGLYYFRGTGARSTMIEGVEFGSYGLKTFEDDIASPTKSAIPEVTQDYNVDPANDVAGAVLKTFAMRQTAISVMEDSESEKCYTLPKHIFADSERGDQNPGYTYTGNYRNVTEIQVDIPYDGDFGMQFIAKNGDEEIIKTGWMATNASTNPKTYLSSIKFSNPTNITSLQFWNVQPWGGGEFKISEIRLYFEGFFITADEDDIAIGEEIELSLEGNATITQDSWQVKSEDGGEATIEQRDGKWYLTGTQAGTVLVEATDANNDKGNITIRIHDMEISGDDEVEENRSITLEKAYVPSEAATFKWFLNGTVIEGNTDEVQLNDDGTLTFTGKSLGERNFKLEAYDSNGEKITTAEKTIKVYRLETYTHTAEKDNELTPKGTNKYFVSLKPIPSKVKIQSITANLSGNANIEQGVHSLYLNKDYEHPVHRNGPNGYNLSGTGNMQWDTLSFSEQITTGVDGSEYAFELWWSTNEAGVTVTSVDIVYRKYDDKDLVMSYVDANGNPISEIKQTIRNGESVYFTLAATGGTVDNIVLKNGETTIDNAINEADGKYTVQPQPAGDYTITATMDDYIRTLKFTVKDKITINGSEIMDLNGSQKLSVSNAIEDIEWSVTADGNYTVEDGDVVTIKESGNIIATFNKSTGDVTTFEYDGEFTLTVNDNYGGEGSTDSITISITERPKLPELPKDIFRELYIKGNSETIKLSAANNWNFTLANLPTHDEKGNPYYYYIQESGYRQTEGGEYKPLTDQTGHFIYSTNASYMPSAYYNNGVAPDKENTPDIVAKVKNKLHSKIQGQLPSTGGSGVTTYYYLGGVIMLLSIAGFTGLKRR
ncbi:MAG: glycoside hydrolase family 9 protein, partial [Oscillospiraceae bacterium]|nr:glycoside hydrolase family 9 protein [Oscillospiraceae bacterium]